MSETSEHLPFENSSAASQPAESNPPAPTPPQAPPQLPASPMERAKLEAEGKIPQHNELQDRSTMVAFGLLFVVPLLIIIFSVLLLLPFINSQLSDRPDPTGVTIQSSPNQLPPTR